MALTLNAFRVASDRKHVDQATFVTSIHVNLTKKWKIEKKGEREACEEAHEESESFIYTRDILFILADTVRPVSNDTLAHVLRFIHVPSILRIVSCSYIISGWNLAPV